MDLLFARDSQLSCETVNDVENSRHSSECEIEIPDGCQGEVKAALLLDTGTQLSNDKTDTRNLSSHSIVTCLLAFVVTVHVYTSGFTFVTMAGSAAQTVSHDQTIFTLSTKSLKLDDAEQLDPHIELLRSPTASDSITTINLSGNTLGLPAAKAFATHLRALKALRVANLDDIFTSRLLSEIPQALEALLNALLELPHLHTVNLSDNAFGLNTQAPLVHFLERHTPLNHLILNNNGLGPKAGALIAEALTRLAEAKQKSSATAATSNGASPTPEHATNETHRIDAVPMLETIICGRNRLEQGSMHAWAQAISAHAAGLKHLKMVQNGIRPEGIQVLLQQGIREARNLQTIDLQDNTFTRTGSAALADVLPGLNNLVELAVGDCLLSTKGVSSVVRALSKGRNVSLEVLRLQYAGATAKDLQALVKALEVEALPKLRRVELNGNHFSSEESSLERLMKILETRRANSGREDADVGDQWGLDYLSDLSEDESDESEADGSLEESEKEEEEERKGKYGKIGEQTEQAENENVAQERNKDVDDLADKLGKTGL